MPWTQYFPTTPMISIVNSVTTGFPKVIPTTPQHIRYPATNILKDARSEKWRAVTQTDTDQLFIGFDFGGVARFDTIGLIDLRLVRAPVEQGIESKDIKFWLCGADNAAFTTNYWEIELWAYDLTVDPVIGTTAMSNVRTIYIDTNSPDDGLLPARRFQKIKFDIVGNAGSYIELGALWLGQRYALPLDAKPQATTESHSPVAKLASDRRFYYPMRRVRHFQFSTTTIKTADSMLVRSQLVNGGEGKPIIVDPYAFTADPNSSPLGGPTYRREANIYGYLDGRIQWEERLYRGGDGWGRLSFGIEEAIA
jgi:hypothetical protein